MIQMLKDMRQRTHGVICNGDVFGMGGADRLRHLARRAQIGVVADLAFGDVQIA